MLLAADLAILTDDGMVAFPEAKSGLFPGNGGAPLRIGRSIHLKHAMELLLTGAPIDAATAVQWGLANRAVPEAELMDAALSLAKAIMANGPYALNLIKQAVYDSMDKRLAHDGHVPRARSEFGRCRRRHNGIPRKTRTAVEGTISCKNALKQHT